MLLQAAETLSPQLEATQPGVVTVELPAGRTLAEDEFHRRVIAPLRELALDVRVGVAATPDLALLAARQAGPFLCVEDAAAFLAPLPAAVLEAAEEIALVLDGWGIRTVGQFVRLPYGPTCQRLGPGAVELWERATGGRARPLRLVKPPEHYVEQVELDHPVETLEPLLFLLRRFLEQITARLAQAHLAAGRLRLELGFDQGASYRRIFTIPQPTRDVALLFRMLHTHLENFTSPSPIVAVELAAQAVRPAMEQFSLLERGLRDPHQFAETLARLHALLGAGRVGTPEVADSHHPDAFTMRPHDPQAPAPAGDDAEEIPPGVPWLRYRPPLPANIICHETRPAYLYSATSTGPIRQARGPWRREGGWWDRGAWQREEWDIVTDDGAYRLVQSDARWFLDGIYA
jgi:protein ImuB